MRQVLTALIVYGLLGALQPG